MDLKKALSVLSKASPFAVSTVGKKEAKLNTFKEYLYVESDIENDFHQNYKPLPPSRTILFFCVEVAVMENQKS